MSSRDEILSAIRRNTKQKFDYPTWELKAITYDNIVDKFCSISREVGGDAVVLGAGEDYNDVVRKHYPDAKRIASVLPDATCATLNPDRVETPQELDGIDIAIVEGAWGVAENGAVWIPQTVKHRVLYFIPEILVILLERNHLVNNMHEAYARIKSDPYCYGTFISGPSKTADIEQALVKGAHGARETLVILR